MKCSTERYSTLNILRLFYVESSEMVRDLNKGLVTGNKGFWLNQAKQDKAALKKHCDEMRYAFLTGTPLPR